jgi:ABC-2 type transport system permease protein
LILSGILFMVLGIWAVSSEYGNGMIRLTLTATPRRGRLFAAKMIVVSLATAGAGVILSLAGFLVAQLIFSAYGLPTADLAQGDAIRAVILEGVLTPVYPLIGAALAILARSTTLPLTGTLVLTFAPTVLASFLSDKWQKILRYTPGAASDALSIAHFSDSSGHSSVAVAILVIVVWLAAFLAPACVVFGRRDA